MLRSLNYAVHTTVGRRPAAERERGSSLLTTWERHARRAFLDGYGAAVAESPVRLVPKSEEELERACAVFELEKACYELRYELNNRPGWASIPARRHPAHPRVIRGLRLGSDRARAHRYYRLTR